LLKDIGIILIILVTIVDVVCPWVIAYRNIILSRESFVAVRLYRRDFCRVRFYRRRYRLDPSTEGPAEIYDALSAYSNDINVRSTFRVNCVGVWDQNDTVQSFAIKNAVMQTSSK